ncbi:NADPH-dependent FMN reductase [Dyadobacter subterraneus]|uniref:NAD(P)H-dependent oxidoreductase n=1 Tax=Dyadobacter subterraneus TaxID=2773304 RepID=A0ABR9WF08_9BACT|nr:NAD(P)H-dependent oxidoreductase [Dyadobacter subterraneus]MBE9462921.1 NAD(P)H-dependent oxidoreductase [Dyadobacter subterraneus]
MKNIQILAISGSLRSNSSNTNILKATAEIAGDSVDFQIYEGLDTFPHFNPGIDEDNEKVAHFREKVKNADGVIICTPEYAFGVPGVLKNALDWTVSTGEFNDKPVVAISASPLNSGGDKALASLLFTLTALGTVKNEGSSLSIPNIKQKISADGKLIEIELKNQLELILINLLEQINKKRENR